MLGTPQVPRRFRRICYTSHDIVRVWQISPLPGGVTQLPLFANAASLVPIRPGTTSSAPLLPEIWPSRTDRACWLCSRIGFSDSQEPPSRRPEVWTLAGSSPDSSGRFPQRSVDCSGDFVDSNGKSEDLESKEFRRF